MRQLDRLHGIDRRVGAFLRRYSIPMLRISLGIVFLWFGILKVAGYTPVTELVDRTVYWVDPGWFVPVLGAAEMFVGVGLILRRLMRLVLGVFALQMAGTFLVLVILPEVAFQQGNVLLLTVEGEFVVKNLVLLTAGMVVGGTVHRASERL